MKSVTGESTTGESTKGKSDGLTERARRVARPASMSAAICVLLVMMGTHAPPISAADDSTRADETAPIAPAAPQLGKTGALIGLPVQNDTGERVGKVVDAVTVVDRQGGQVSYIILSRAALDAADRHLYPVPAPALDTDPAGERLVLDMTGNELRGTGGFRRAQWPKMTDRAWGERLHTAFALTPYWLQPGGESDETPADTRELPVE